MVVFLNPGRCPWRWKGCSSGRDSRECRAGRPKTLYLKELEMKALIALAVVVVSMVLVGCASTEPNALTGQRPIVNDKGVVVGYYQAR